MKIDESSVQVHYLTMSDIAIIIVNWNTGHLLAQCVQSLQEIRDRNLISQIYVIDNASRDDSIAQAERVINKNVPIRFNKLHVNLGFAAANNLGISEANKSSNTPAHILLLNPDTAVRDGALTAMRRVFDMQAQVGIVGCTLENPDGSHQSSVRRFPTFAVFLWLFLKLNSVAPKTRLWQQYLHSDFDYSRAATVDQVMGAVFLIRNQVLKDIGLLDAKFWVWFEEVDFCRRAAQAGWLTYYTPEGTVVHHGGVSFRQLIGLKKTVPWVKSCLHYARKHLALWQWLTLVPLSAIPVVAAVPASVYHRAVLNRHQPLTQ